MASDYTQTVPGWGIIWEARQHGEVTSFGLKFLAQEEDSGHVLVRGWTTKAIGTWNIVQQLEWWWTHHRPIQILTLLLILTHLFVGLLSSIVVSFALVEGLIHRKVSVLAQFPVDTEALWCTCCEGTPSMSSMARQWHIIEIIFTVRVYTEGTARRLVVRVRVFKHLT